MADEINANVYSESLSAEVGSEEILIEAQITAENEIDGEFVENAADISAVLSEEKAVDGEVTLFAGGVANDYNLLINKPKINGIELIGDRTNEEIKIEALSEFQIEEILQSVQ